MSETFTLVERRHLAETPNATFWAVLDTRCANGWRLAIIPKGKAYVWGRSRLLNARAARRKR